jgi:quaternary ammonium compound-resistance protein SugE
MAWIYLIIAGVLEVAWAIGLKKTEGFTRLPWSIATIAGMIASFYVLSLAVKPGGLPIGTGYAIWTGIGAVGTAILGVILFAEPLTAARVICLILIVGGMIGLKMTSGH